MNFNWTTAKSYCEDRGLELATVTSLEQATFINSHYDSLTFRSLDQPSRSTASKRIFLGGHRDRARKCRGDSFRTLPNSFAVRIL
ncbi:hypothetical protein Ocin01_18062, partial [Orchesella cincta]